MDDGGTGKMRLDKPLDRTGPPPLRVVSAAKIHFGSELGQDGTARYQQAFNGPDGSAGSKGFTNAAGVTVASEVTDATGPWGPRGAAGISDAAGRWGR